MVANAGAAGKDRINTMTGMVANVSVVEKQGMSSTTGMNVCVMFVENRRKMLRTIGKSLEKLVIIYQPMMVL